MSSIVMDAFLYIYKLKLKLEAIKREYLKLINYTQVIITISLWYMRQWLQSCFRLIHMHEMGRKWK